MIFVRSLDTQGNQRITGEIIVIRSLKKGGDVADFLCVCARPLLVHASWIDKPHEGIITLTR